MNCSLQETDLHLLLKNKMLMNTEATVYDSHIENGDILEIVVSSHSIISKVLQAQARMRNDMEYTVDPQSLLSSRLLFLQLSNGESSLPTQTAIQYLASVASEQRSIGIVGTARFAVSDGEYIHRSFAVASAQLFQYSVHSFVSDAIALCSPLSHWL